MAFEQTQKIVLASSNTGKIREIQYILQNYHIVPQSEYHVVDADETGTTFVENAIIKARHASLLCNLPAIADDSGLVVDALNGAPGIVSARYAGMGVSDQENLDKLLIDLKDIPDENRQARFVCVMVYLRNAIDPMPLIAYGVWEGSVLASERGENGFGYDPVFWVPTHEKASAELSKDEKNAISHRGQALQTLSNQILASG